MTSLTHIATQSMPMVSCLSSSMAIFSFVPTPSVPETSTGSSMPAASSANRPPKPPMPSTQPAVIGVQYTGSDGPGHMLLHQFHRRVTGGNVNTRCLVAFALALHHGCLLLCRVSRHPALCRREWAGRICSSPSPAAGQPGICRRSSPCRIRSGCPPPACRTPPGTKSRWSPHR